MKKSWSRRGNYRTVQGGSFLGWEQQGGREDFHCLFYPMLYCWAFNEPLLFCHLQSGGRSLLKSSCLNVSTLNDFDISEWFRTLNLKFVVICYSSYRKVVQPGRGSINLPLTSSVTDFHKHVWCAHACLIARVLAKWAFLLDGNFQANQWKNEHLSQQTHREGS